MSDQEPTVFLVDDDPSVLRAVSRLVRAEGFNVASFASARDFLELYDQTACGCAVIDVAMPGLDGLQLQQSLAQRGGSVPIIFLTGRGDVPMSVRAMKQGAVDFLTKPVKASMLISAIRSAISKDLVAREAHAEVAAIRKRLATLTPREYEVFQHVVSGQLNKQTAANLGTAEKTVKVHRARVMQKMQVQSLAELVRLAERLGVTASTFTSSEAIPWTKVQ